MMFRSLFVTAACSLAALGVCQRPTATLVRADLVRLDLDGFHVFADMPDSAEAGTISMDDVSLFAVEPPAAPEGGRTFTPSMTGAMLDRRTERLGERTGIYVRPYPTPYGDVPHASYLVQWSGRRVWFSGLTTDPAELLAARDLDLAFITPAVAEAVAKEHRTIDARMVVFYHTSPAQQEGDIPEVRCERCRVLMPRIGDAITLFR